MIVRSQRRSLVSAAVSGDGFVADLWSTDERWRDAIAEARDFHGRVVILSSLGLTEDHELTPYEKVLSKRENAAREVLPTAVTLRLGPLFEDLAVYDEALRTRQTIYHCYDDTPVPWLSASDVVAVASATGPGHEGLAFDLAGTDPASFTDALAERARRLDAPPPATQVVPAAALTAQLEGLFGKGHAQAIVGHQVWSTRVAATAASGAATLVEALDHQPTPWRAGAAAPS